MTLAQLLMKRFNKKESDALDERESKEYLKALEISFTGLLLTATIGSILLDTLKTQWGYTIPLTYFQLFMLPICIANAYICFYLAKQAIVPPTASAIFTLFVLPITCLGLSLDLLFILKIDSLVLAILLFPLIVAVPFLLYFLLKIVYQHGVKKMERHLLEL
ncbi:MULTISPECIES: hypothetical protein [Carnobacterium]|uniref:hypothetical protein n=1 Tax=Carnobacterium TaxID=2747 RepID=UPI001071D161|nr:MULTISPECIES: hypothetical protein [Carnobacterium]MDT1940533.1 hypothetical protein [Carnobacterium divergens]MDT1942971.1 hypothetical protein [Carnobacterium divergens]MDT1948778.1 hypothetical protein [Carnobacterium divergens]MDT1951258.1 hypothetical protein [Carnobacterium divergens]MDT1956316.1 hypothetical protein [Carnobacterium divergens]